MIIVASLCNILHVLGAIDSDSSGAPLEVSFKSDKIKDKAKRFSEILDEDENLLTRLLKTPKSDKKKKNKLTESQKLDTTGMSSGNVDDWF